MDAQEFNKRADAMLARIETALENCSADFDYEFLDGGVIELDFEQNGGSKIIINRHSAAQEIWIAAKSGGYHFRLVDEGGTSAALGRWLSAREDLELMQCLAQCMSEQAGASIRLSIA